jgi:hypothetical protein
LSAASAASVVQMCGRILIGIGGRGPRWAIDRIPMLGIDRPKDRSLSTGRSRRNISAANTIAFSSSQPPTMMPKADMAFPL